MRKIWFTWLGLAPLVAGCGPKVETPFEGQGRYEGQYRSDRSPPGWRGQTQEETARREEPRHPPGWGTPAEEERYARRERREEPAAPPRAPEPQAPERAQTPERAPVAAVRPGTPAAALQAMGKEIQTFRASEDTGHVALVAALRNLSAALEGTPGARSSIARIKHIDRFADRIEASDPASREHANWTKQALQEGVASLAAIAQEEGAAALEPRIQRLQLRVDGLNTEKPLVEQRAAYAEAFTEIRGLVAQLQEGGAPPATR